MFYIHKAADFTYNNNQKVEFMGKNGHKKFWK